MKTLHLVAAAAAVALATHSLEAAPAAPARRPVARAAVRAAAPKIEKTRLGNGLTVILAPDSLAAAADVAVWYRAGAVFEPPGMTGITHLFERLMFRGDPARGGSEYRRRLVAEGAVVNTATTPDFTSFFATVPPEAVPLAIRLEADRMGRMPFDAAGLEAERDFVRQERRQFIGGNPLGLGIDRLFATAFPEHGYGRPVLGLEADLESISLAEVTAYHRVRYAPRNAILTVTGRFDVATTRAAIETSFGSLPGGGLSAPRGALVAPPPPLPRAVEPLDAPMAVMLAGWRGPGAADPNTAALELLSELISGGSAARILNVSAESPGRFLQVRGGVDLRQGASLLYVYGVLNSPADSAAAEAAILDAVESLVRTPVAAQDLLRARRRLELAALHELQTARGRARAIGTHELASGDVAGPWNRLAAIRAATPADVQKAAQRVLLPGQRAIVWMMPPGGSTVEGLGEEDRP